MILIWHRVTWMAWRFPLERDSGWWNAKFRQTNESFSSDGSLLLVTHSSCLLVCVTISFTIEQAHTFGFHLYHIAPHKDGPFCRRQAHSRIQSGLNPESGLLDHVYTLSMMGQMGHGSLPNWSICFMDLRRHSTVSFGAFCGVVLWACYVWGPFLWVIQSIYKQIKGHLVLRGLCHDYMPKCTELLPLEQIG